MNRPLHSVTALRIGKLVLERFEEEMNKKSFTYQDFKKLQNDYEKILLELLKEAYSKGKNDLSKREFDIWLESVSAYEEESKL